MIIFSYHTKNYYICTHKNKHSQNIHINNNKNSNDKDRNCKQDLREYWHLKEGSSHSSGKSHGDCKGKPAQERAHLTAWLRQLHHQASCREDSSQHTEEYYCNHPRTRLPQLQACQGVRGEDEEQLSIQRKNITI